MKKRYAWDDRAPSFRQVGDVAASVAEYHAGVQLDETTRERWRELMALPLDGTYRGRLLREAWRESPPAMRAIVHPRVLGGFAVMSVNRLRNRLRHGVTTDPSLRIIGAYLLRKRR